MTTKEINSVKVNLDSEYGSRAYQASKYYLEEPGYVPIFSRTSTSPIKQDSMVNAHASFMKTIIQQKIGFIGSLNVFCANENQALTERVNQWLKSFQAKNQFETRTPQTVEWTAIEGLSHRLIYLRDGYPRIKNLHSWQVAYEYDDDIFNPSKAYVFYEVKNASGKTEKRFDIYDSENVEYYYKSNNAWVARVPEGMDSNIQPHFMGRVPVIPILNNEQMMGDCSPSVLRNIDVYDVTQSDVLSELKASRLAYLKIFGDIYTGYKQDYEGNFLTDDDGNKIPIDVPSYLREFGAMVFKTDDEGKPQGDAQYLEKRMDDAVIEHNLDRMREQIFMDSQAVDERSILQGSNQRVIAIKSAYDKLEKKCSTFEEYFISSLRIQYEMLFNLAVEGLLEGFSVTEEEKQIVLDSMQYVFNHNELVDDEIQARVLEVNMRTMSPEDAYALNPLTSHDAMGFKERWIASQESEIYNPGMNLIDG